MTATPDTGDSAQPLAAMERLVDALTSVHGLFHKLGCGYIYDKRTLGFPRRVACNCGYDAARTALLTAIRELVRERDVLKDELFSVDAAAKALGKERDELRERLAASEKS